ncbi:MAG: GNAT family N-acetyltransferase, partial [Kofleriaceae bacterium]|nr:GNAT family N-acetyltransferase [Kofleriaceae bacterium]
MTLRIEALTRGSLDEAREVLRNACPWDRAAVVAEEKLFDPGASGASGEALAAYEGGAMVGVASTSGGWLRLLAVCPTRRRRGVGTALLQACEHQISAHAGSIAAMAQPGNYLSPGIDERNLETIAWLEKRGFVRTGSSCNLLVPLDDNPVLTSESFEKWQEKLSVLGYEV